MTIPNQFIYTPEILGNIPAQANADTHYLQKIQAWCQLLCNRFNKQKYIFKVKF